jgi:hypothetical protein
MRARSADYSESQQQSSIFLAPCQREERFGGNGAE